MRLPFPFALIMPKRPAFPVSSPSPAKRPRSSQPSFVHNKIASSEAAARVDADPPINKLLHALENRTLSPNKGDTVVYWMRMEDMRTYDNRALFQASEQAKKDNIPLVALFVLSPQDYIAHDRSPRRVDFTLRNLSVIKSTLAKLHIPLQTTVHTPRRTVPDYIVSFLSEVGATRVFANIEYEVDELRRDIRVCELAKDVGIRPTFVHDKLIVEPGMVSTKQGKPFTVYSPFLRQWLPAVNGDIQGHIGEAPPPFPNSPEMLKPSKLKHLFECEVPEEIEGFECKDKATMEKVWPAGSDAAREMLSRFLRTKSRASHAGISDPLEDGAEPSNKRSRILTYGDTRDRADKDTTSRLSPYLAAGVISARDCVRGTMDLLGISKVDAGRDSGVGRWVQELAWRDFYTHVLAAFPRVSMGRTFQGKFDDVQWETDEAHFTAWKEGRTGVPIVDAAVRQANTMGWMHNRSRMIAAMYLTKDLMIDWRLGERHFMEQFIDGDLASNNGGWQWSASTGTDPQPYFRIFNPYNQSEKADPSGDYIRAFVPELSKVFGPDIHKPPPALADKLGYPRPLVDHKEARERALRRYKNPGTK
ncbi:DNA photolyase, FAD-binding/Cryptochrome [Amylostereum chailletii]|nr:DNA photolyase, FAD-binding/Cryptochrome [Amylostereum chailletii]